MMVQSHRNHGVAFKVAVCLLWVLFGCGRGYADITLPPLFSDGLVLQASARAPVWGKAQPGEKITVAIAGQSKETVANPQGNWRVDFENLAAGGPFEMTVEGENTLTIKNVLIGEVWLASGQSNMAYGLGSALNPKEEMAAANYPFIHVFNVKMMVASNPLEVAEGSWKVCTPENAETFSATGYFFVRDLHKAIKKPVGLIHSSVSGTMAEAWISPAAMKGEPDFEPILQRFSAATVAYSQEYQTYKKKISEWEETAAKAGEAQRKPPAKPREPPNPAKQTKMPGGLFNGQIAPLIPFGIRGVIWYQGEYNSERGEQYRKLFPTLIRDWRQRWGQGNFPFLFVQLANFDIQPQPNNAHYDELREAQLRTLSVTNTGMAVACDVGDAANIHPPNKQAIGGRLALIARATVYGENMLVFSGPFYQGMKVEGDVIRLSFEYLGGGLILRSGGAGSGFVMAGEDRKFVSAEARIDGDTVVVSCPQVKQPVAVRYAWADNPTCTLYNHAGLPASPFRTDDWPLLSAGKR